MKMIESRLKQKRRVKSGFRLLRLRESILALTAVFVPYGGLSVFAMEPGKEVNPYPETREEIDAYKEHLIRRHHEEICDYPEEITKISSLKELAEYSGKSGVHVKMEPGVYRFTPDNYDEFLKQSEREDHVSLLDFSGTHSYFDLRGVEIRIDTGITILAKSDMTEVVVTGDKLILEGLTVTDVGNNASDRYMKTFGSGGDNNLLQGLTVTCRGSFPYGYAEGRQMGQWGFPRSRKKEAFGAGGNNTVYMDIKIHQRASGHALVWSGHTNQTFIDCHIDGEVRFTDDILAEISEPGYGPRFDDREFQLKNKLKPGRLIPLCEDAFRSYGDEKGGTVKVLGCTVKNVRHAFKRGNYEKAFISNTKVLRSHGGYMRSSVGPTKIVNSEVDLLYGNFLMLWGQTFGHEIELTVVPADPDFLPVEIGHRNRTAIIAGRDHEILLRSRGERRIKNPPPIIVEGENIKLWNQTGIPIKLIEKSRNCRIITNGEVTDNGKGNKIKYRD